MSLSYTPKVEITPKTAKDICDDIWAGAIDFAEETGISTNPMVTTAIWSGLLISVKPTLEEHKLYEEVRKCFAASLDDVYHIGLGKVELLAELKYSMLTFCQNISENIGSFDTELKISAFLGLVSDVYSDCSSDPSPLPQNSVQLFSRYTFLLSSHIFEILYKTENSMVPQFQGIKYTQPQRKPVHAAADPKPSPRKAPVQQASKAPKSAKVPAFCWFIAGVLVVAILVVLLGRAVDAIYPSDISAESDVSVNSAYNTVTAPKVDTVTIPKQTVEEPENGHIFSALDMEGIVPFTIESTGSGGYFFVLDPISLSSLNTIKSGNGADSFTQDFLVSMEEENFIKFYIRAGETFSISVPVGTYDVYYAAGDDWYGENDLFGSDTVYYRCAEPFRFTMFQEKTTGWTIILERTPDGNLEVDKISSEDFPK